ncbi:MAG: F0F1 ATP synthase subunit epsilon [Xanthomonadales bacterium]|nr:F0F1 ATP synthase subunit epsilon [Gammaproteobacteria bacterium]MBT8064104.1 F0F1 ATP synthase subunit epsilon [Gammaproteobacteria bacterium]NNJ64866.1 F0F1 ATP synthase subunit epsilon [Xanthomonadales bacterium]
MSATVQCDIVSAQTEIFSGEVSCVIALGETGELGIYPRHAPLMTRLEPGPIRLLMPDGEEVLFFVGGGLLEVMPHLVTVLADTAVRAADLDEAAATRARDEAERELAHRTGEMEIAEVEARLIEALAQLRAIKQLRKKLKSGH